MKLHSFFLYLYNRIIIGVVLPFMLFLNINAVGSTIGDENDETENPVVWHTFDEATNKAAHESKLLFIFVEAEWCHFCKRMKSEVFTQKEISRLLNERYYAVSIDVDSREKLDFMGKSLSERAFAREQQISATPTMIFMEPDGTELGRQPGAIDSDELKTILKYVDSEFFGKRSLEEFKNMDS